MVLFLTRTGAQLTGRWSCPGDPSVVNLLWVCTHGLYYVTCRFLVLIFACMHSLLHVAPSCCILLLVFAIIEYECLGFDVQSNVL